MDLYYSIKLAKKDDGNFTLLISHPNGTYSGRWMSDVKEQQIQRREQTRQFVKWFRKTFPHILTEFRGLSSSHWYDSKRHFVAYDVSPKDLILIKLSWTYTSRELSTGYSDGDLGSNYIYEWHHLPSEEYQARLDKAREKAEQAKAEL